MAKFIKKKINDEFVKPILIGKGNSSKKIKGEKLFSEIYANIFLCGKKKSGKTSTLYKILDECAGKNTKIIVFASTIYKDSNFLAMMEHFKKKGISFTPLVSINEGGTNQIQLIVDALTEKSKKDFESSQKEPYMEKQKVILMDSDDSADEEEIPKEKYEAPEYIIVFDDVSNELRDPALEALLKKNRHFKTKIIISSQAYIDLTPSSRQQLDYILLFPKLPEDKLKMIWKDSDLTLGYNDFITLYNDATAEKYNFLYIDTRNDEFRKNFNVEYSK